VHAPVAVSKDMLAVKLCSNKVFQFLPGGGGGGGWVVLVRAE